MKRFVYYKQLSTTYILIFTCSTSWTVPVGVTSAQVLVCGGGGAGAGSSGGGGGGAAVYNATYGLYAGQVIPITIGAGGVFSGTVVRSGSTSAFSGLTAAGGGGAGLYQGVGGNGGCGGGAGRGATHVGGTGSVGFNGGNTQNYSGGGGGGMGSSGVTGGSIDDVYYFARVGSYSAGGNGLDYSAIYGQNFGLSGWCCAGGGGYWQYDGNPSYIGEKNPAPGGTGGGGWGVYQGNSAYPQTWKDGWINTGSGGGSGGSGAAGVVAVKYTI